MKKNMSLLTLASTFQEIVLLVLVRNPLVERAKLS